MTEKEISLFLAMTSIGATVSLGIIVKEFYQKIFKKRIGFKFLIKLGLIAIPILFCMGMSWEFVKSIAMSIMLSIIILEMLVYSDELDQKIGGEKQNSP